MSNYISPATVRSGLNTQNGNIEAILEQLPNAISSINDYVDDSSLTGAAYAAHKEYLSNGHIPFLQSLENALNAFITANDTHVQTINAELPHPHYDQDITDNTLKWLNISIPHLQDMVYMQGQYYLLPALNDRIRMRADWNDRRARLEAYLSFTNFLYSNAETAMQTASTNLQRLEFAWKCPVTGSFILPTAEELLVFIIEAEIADLIANPDKIPQLSDARRQEIIDYISGKHRGEDVTKIPSDERNLLIECYERNYSANTRVINDFMRGIIDAGDHTEDVANIKYLAYAAPEPYHSVFFKYLPDLTLVTHHAPSLTGQMCFAGLVFVDLSPQKNVDKGSHDPRGSYATFFHEIGHGIDFAMSKSAGFNNTIGNLLNPSTGNSLNDLIYADVENRIRQEIENLGKYSYPLSKADRHNIQTILNSLMKGGTMDSSDPLYADRARVQEAFGRRADGKSYNRNGILYGPLNNGASDVYWGVTGENISGNWGHSQAGYWNIFDPSLEFFAHSFSVNMTQYTAQLNSMNTLFPDASSAFQDIMNNDSKVGIK